MLNSLLSAQPHQQLDIATAYFSIRGYQRLRATLSTVGEMRLLLGGNPAEGVDMGLNDPDNLALRNAAAHDQTLAPADAGAALAAAITANSSRPSTRRF